MEDLGFDPYRATGRQRHQGSEAEVNTALGGLSPQKVHTSVLAEDAVRAALKKYRQH